MIPGPPTTFPAINRIKLPLATDLHRIHNSSFAGNSFNPCQGRASRFAPLVRSDGTCIPTMYAATNLECAVHETVFHEIQHDAKYKSIGYHEIENLEYSVVRPRRDLVLASLFEPDLNRWGLTRRQLIDTFAADYEATAEWAIALHHAFSEIDQRNQRAAPANSRLRGPRQYPDCVLGRRSTGSAVFRTEGPRSGSPPAPNPPHIHPMLSQNGAYQALCRCPNLPVCYSDQPAKGADHA
jgi:hypothetical protein